MSSILLITYIREESKLTKIIHGDIKKKMVKMCDGLVEGCFDRQVL
jgi:hypothetical protein